MRLVFDRGTLLFAEGVAGIDLAGFPEVLWDPRVSAFRAPARLAYPLVSALRRQGVQLADAPRPTLAPPAAFRPPALRRYQEAALAAWRLGGRRGVVVLPTGAGKTRVALAAMAATRTPVLCVVPTKALLAQWHAAIAEIYDGPIGRLGDGERRIEAVTVATAASAYRHMARLGSSFGLLIVDEAHHFGGGCQDEALEMAIAPLRLGLTATAHPPGPAAARLALLVGPTVYELAVGDLTGDALAPLARVTLRLPLEADERAEYDALRAVYARAFQLYRGAHLGGRFEDFLHHAATSEAGRAATAAWRRAARLLAYPRRKREALALLLRQHHAQRTLVFVADNETAYAVARERLVMPLTCDVGGREREAALQAFRRGELRALVSAQVLNEGIDVPDAEVAIVVAGRRGVREHVQRVGRVLRPAPGKRALLYELVVPGTGEVTSAERRAAPLVANRPPRARSAA